jgi:hypothetical protein
MCVTKVAKCITRPSIASFYPLRFTIFLIGTEILDISSIQLQEKGIAKLQYKLNINEASGPDTISCRILQEAADEIAPFL